VKFWSVLGVAVALVSSAACSGSVGSTPVPGPSSSAPPAGSIQHVVVLMQENRSFDNIFAGFPGADTTLVGKCLPAPNCKGSHMIRLHSLPLESTGVPNRGTDIDHSHTSFEVECDANALHVCQMDGFNKINFGESGNQGKAHGYPYAYVERSETKPYWDFARRYTLADEMFFTETASSFIAHQMILSGTVQLKKGEWVTDQPSAGPPWGCFSAPGNNAPILYANGKEKGQPGVRPCFDWATIADLLDAKNVSWLDYVESGGTIAGGPHGAFDFSGGVWNGFGAIRKIYHGPDWQRNITFDNRQIFSDLKAGKLPAVSWVIPTLYDSDHPASGCNGGPWWVTNVVNAIGESSYWKSTAIVIIWDDWGGWYDNAPPKYFNPSTLGFRVGMIVVSPYSRAATVVHTQYDFGSILKLMEETFNLGSLGTTDASANSMKDAFDFTQTPLTFKPEPLPQAMRCKDEVTNPKDVDDIIRHNGGIPE
jgi:phospholipase C